MEPFQDLTDRYDDWFETYDYAYESELTALDRLIPAETNGIEIGVGTGRFAAPLGIEFGLDPSPAMLHHARQRGIEVVQGVAESLPFAGSTFDTVLLVTTICFVDDIDQTIREAKRILRSDGHLVIGYIDGESPVGKQYKTKKDENPFYQDATFVTTDEVVDTLEASGFTSFDFVQTIFEMPGEMTSVEPIREGYGEGSFVGIRARP